MSKWQRHAAIAGGNSRRQKQAAIAGGNRKTEKQKKEGATLFF
jgi:hypothetical protein